MKKLNTSFAGFVFLLLFLANPIISQTTITLQPDGEKGKDALILSSVPDNNYGNHIDLPSIAWTNGGNTVVGRGLINFDLSQIPDNAVITSAKLSLFSYVSPANGGHSSESGPNTSIIKRITTDWDEQTVNWNNQPKVDTQFQVFIGQSTTEVQDYLGINVTAMIKSAFANPESNFGMMLSLLNEEFYRRMIFASSDNEDSSLHPKLEITYLTDVECTLLRPDAIIGKDAIIDDRLSDNNNGNHRDLGMFAWTNGGTPVNVRGLIDFDLSEIPENATINSALLSLYSYLSTANGSHSTQDGSNESVIQRIITPWEEDEVTWNNQPMSTSEDEIYMEASVNDIQDYLNIDITTLMQNSFEDPDNSHGFMLKLITEDYYRKLVFGSSDNDDPLLHPQLEVCYTVIESIIENEEIAFKIYPNPASESLMIDLQDNFNDVISIDILNSLGQQIDQITSIVSINHYNVKELAAGVYVLKVNSDTASSIQTFVVE